MKTIIAGASGFIGQHLCSMLKSIGDEIITLSREDFITGKWYLSNQEIHAFKIHYLKQRFSDEGITSVKNHIRRSLR